jgi:hypothetical protein
MQISLTCNITLFFIANNLLESIDETVDPCENFYRFTCGNWIRNRKIPTHGKVFILIIIQTKTIYSICLPFTDTHLSQTRNMENEMNSAISGELHN